jgi:hypothetical protein
MSPGRHCNVALIGDDANVMENSYFIEQNCAFAACNKPEISKHWRRTTRFMRKPPINRSSSFVLTACALAAAISATAQPYPTAVVADGPAAYWKLNEATGTVAADSAGTDNGSYTNGLLNQQGYAQGVASFYSYSPATDSSASAEFGTQAGFVSDSYVGGLTLDLASTTNTAFTLEAWVNGTVPQNNGAGIVGKGYGAGGEEAYLDCGGSGSAFRFFIRNAAGTAANAASTKVADGNWHHLAGVCDEVHGSIYLYVDGQLAASNSASGGIKAATNLYMTIGARQSTNGANYDDQFSGEIGQVAVYRYALSAAQVLNHYYAAGIPATITSQPVGYTNVDEGTTLVLTGAAIGTPPLSYQWISNNVAITGQTNSTITLSNISAALYNNTTVSLVAANQYGTNQTSGTTISVNYGGATFVTNPQPATLSLYPGAPFTYTVGVSGTQPFSYQWYHGASSVLGATNASYTATTQAGTNSYYCVVSNSYNGGTLSTSLVASLVSVPIPTASYPSTIVAAGPLAYWRLDEPETGSGDYGVVANDYMGGHDGAYNGVVLGVPGYAPSDTDTACEFGTNGGFGFGSLMQETDNSAGGVPRISSYLQSSNVEFSVECWVNAAANSQNSSGSTIVSLGNFNAEAFYIDASGPGGEFRYLYRNKAGTSGTIYSTFRPDGNWHQLVAVVDEGGAGATVFYVDGNLGGTLGALQGTGMYPNTAPLSIGSDGNYQFNGTIDEVSFYNYPLSLGQIQAHYKAAPLPPAFEAVPPAVVTGFVGGSVTLTTTVIGATPMTNQWFSNNVPLAGQTNVFLILNNLTPGTNNFTLWVTNAFGVTNSGITSVQVATGAGPPVLLADVKPTNATFYATESISYSVSVSGSTPLHYQWWSNNLAVSGATNSTYAITNLVLADAGSYYCAISNQFSNIVSSTAVLGVVPAPTNPYALTVMRDHPASYWRLDEANGSTIGYDYVGGNNGVYSNTAGINHQSGAFGTNYDADTAANFNTNATYTKTISGISNYLGVTMTNVDFSVPNGQNAAFSIEAWARGYGNINQPSGGGIVAKGYGNGGEEFNIDAHTGLRFYCRNAAGTVTATAQAAPTLTGNATGWTMDGKWHHIVGVCDQVNANLLLYVDGTLIGYPVISNGVVPFEAYQYQTNHNPTTGTNGVILPGTGVFPAVNYTPTNWWDNAISIGARNSGQANTGYTLAFLGAVDEVAVYPYCLTPLQVSNHFAVAINAATTLTATPGPNQTTVLSWYPMFGSAALQSAPAVTGPWSSITGATSPYTVTNTGPALFYRLKNY